MALDLTAIGKTIDGFAKTRFRVLDDDEFDNAILAASHDEPNDWSEFATVFADDCAEPIVEILLAAPALLRLARLGAAYLAWVAAYDAQQSPDAAADELAAAYQAAKEMP